MRDNTPEGLWAAPRTLRRPLRGVRTHDRGPYVAVVQWAYNLKEAIPDTLRIILRLTPDAS